MKYTRCHCKVPGENICPFCNSQTLAMVRDYEERSAAMHGYQVFGVTRGLRLGGDFGQASPSPLAQQRATRAPSAEFMRSTEQERRKLQLEVLRRL